MYKTKHALNDACLFSKRMERIGWIYREVLWRLYMFFSGCYHIEAEPEEQRQLAGFIRVLTLLVG